MVEQFIPIAWVLVCGIGFGAGTLALNFLLGPRIFSAKKKLPYECGLEPLQEKRGRYSIHFYMIALLFIVFDIEVVFFFLWALVVRSMGWYAVIEMALFVIILLVAYFYMIKKGVFDLGMDYGH
jgi:NADH-quinone oxidoreductase subunit A